MAGYKGDHAEVKPLYTTPPAAQESGPVSIKKVAEGHGMNLPTEFVPKRDESKAAIRSLTDQCAALIQERDELQKRVWQYEKLTPPAAPVQEPRHIVQSNGRHSLLLTHMMNSRNTPPAAQRQPLTDDEIWKFWWSRPAVDDGDMESQFVAAVRAVLAAHGITGEKPDAA
jgi:hypothetical protein